MINAEYISHMGSDLTVVNAARVSFDKESELEEGVLSGPDDKLIQYLAKHQHFTPFTHPQITFRETVPIFVARQRFKHVVGFTYNERSRRYVDDTPEFHFPSTWRGRPGASMKQGSSGEAKNQSFLKDRYSYFMEQAKLLYMDFIEDGVAPEQARMLLPQSMLTSYYVTGSLAAFARAAKLRLDHHAQVEIQDLASQWDALIRPLFPVSWSALID